MIKVPGKFEFDWDAEMGEHDLMAFSPTRVRRADSDAARAALAALGVEVQSRWLVTVAGGGAGTGLHWRLPVVADALDGFDVTIVGLLGDSIPLRRAATKAAISGRHNVFTVDYIRREIYDTILSGSDLNIGYPGSNSVAEQLAYENPNVLLAKTTGTLASQNVEWARRTYGMKGYYLSDPDGLRHGLRSALAEPAARRRQAERYVANSARHSHLFLEQVGRHAAQAKRVRSKQIRSLRLKSLACAAGAAGFATAAIWGARRG